MKIPMSSLLNNIASGTLQVPQYGYQHTPADVGPGTFTQIQMVEIPDDWVIMLRGNRPCVGKETGYLYLTKKGYAANIPQIRQIWEAAGGQWSEFEKMAESHFKAVEKATMRLINELKKRVEQAEALLTKI